MKDLFQYPKINSAVCVLTLSPVAQCTACVDICPRNALCLDDDSLGLDEDACDACGLCRPACPEGAVEIPVNLALREDSEQGITAFLACSRAGVQHEDGTVPCLHAVGMRDIQHLAEEGVAQIALACGDCQTCPRNSDRSFDRSVEDFNALQKSRGKAIMRLERLPIATWRHEIDSRRKHTSAVDQGRRQFLSLFTGRHEAQLGHRRRSPTEIGDTESWIYAAVPEIDGTKCNGCDACVRVCPHGVLALSHIEAGSEYRIDPGQCTGCQLCNDVCDQGAVTLKTMVTQKQRSVPLKGGKCRICGVRFHAPKAAKGQHDTCPICAKTGHHVKLFQVLD